ncbi:MAG: hypothetical protein MJY88_06290 [Bacteroidales bacterium]|nr:hypothetical protein [Bacteroidales bacterium]
MKRILSILAASIIAALPAFAAAEGVEAKSGSVRPRNEVSVSYGTLSVPHVANILGGVFGTAFTGGLAKVDKIATSGAIGVEYLNYLNSHIAVGGSIVEERLTLNFGSYDGKDEDGNATYKDGEDQHNNYITIMPTAKLPWFYYDHFSMYSKAGAGICVGTDSGDVTFGMQLSPIGLDFGGKAFRGFAEVGFGMQGFLLAGLRWGF